MFAAALTSAACVGPLISDSRQGEAPVGRNVPTDICVRSRHCTHVSNSDFKFKNVNPWTDVQLRSYYPFEQNVGRIRVKSGTYANERQNQPQDNDIFTVVHGMRLYVRKCRPRIGDHRGGTLGV